MKGENATPVNLNKIPGTSSQLLNIFLVYSPPQARLNNDEEGPKCSIGGLLLRTCPSSSSFSTYQFSLDKILEGRL